MVQSTMACWAIVITCIAHMLRFMWLGINPKVIGLHVVTSQFQRFIARKTIISTYTSQTSHSNVPDARAEYLFVSIHQVNVFKEGSSGVPSEHKQELWGGL